MFTRLAALFAFAIALNCSAALLPNPIVLVHGFQLTPNPFGAPDNYGTWKKYYEALTPVSEGYVGGGVWRATTRGGRVSGAQCVLLLLDQHSAARAAGPQPHGDCQPGQDRVVAS